MIGTPFIKHRTAAERKTGGGLIISVFQSGALKLPADCFVSLLLRFKIRGDFPAWEDHFGETISPTSGDFDSNGIVNAADYLLCKTNFEALATGSEGTAAVPEPTTLLLALLALTAVPLRVRCG